MSSSGASQPAAVSVQGQGDIILVPPVITVIIRSLSGPNKVNHMFVVSSTLIRATDVVVVMAKPLPERREDFTFSSAMVWQAEQCIAMCVGWHCVNGQSLLSTNEETLHNN